MNEKTENKKIELKGIKIGKYFIEKPIVQGGMGVGISWDQLAGNVAKNGCLGTISAICTGYYQNMRFVKKAVNGMPTTVKHFLKFLKMQERFVVTDRLRVIFFMQ